MTATPGPAPAWAPYPATVPRRGAPTWLVIVALATSAAALLSVVGLAVLLLAQGVLGGAGGERPLTGQADVTGGSVTGAALAQDVRALVVEDGGEVTSMKCPDTANVGQGTVSVCHARISGDPWAVVIIFEDGDGRLTAVPV